VQIPLRRGPLRWDCWQRTIQVSARKLVMPTMCACCLRESIGTTAASHVRLRGFGASRGSEKSWMFPICGACQHHVQAGRKVSTRARAAASLAFVIPVAGCSLIGLWWVGVIIGGFAALIAWLVAKALHMKQIASLASPTCACLGPAVRFDGFHGTVQTFRFANEHYASAFEAENASKVV
jgi:hypothetical protein